jgi:hypothetical protein
MWGSPEYRSWNSMVTRCHCPNHKNYKHYGGRGIEVCNEWRSFATFYADMGPRPSPKHSLDRIDNEKGYEPGNCRWATREQQCRNTSRNKRITINGTTRLLCDWEKETGIKGNTLIYRLSAGWPQDRLLVPAFSGQRPPG